MFGLLRSERIFVDVQSLEICTDLQKLNSRKDRHDNVYIYIYVLPCQTVCMSHKNRSALLYLVLTHTWDHISVAMRQLLALLRQLIALDDPRSATSTWLTSMAVWLRLNKQNDFPS